MAEPQPWAAQPLPPWGARRLLSTARLALRRPRLLARAAAAEAALAPLADRTGTIRPGDVLAFVTLRNEAARLPFFLQHYRALGVAHFLVVDNASEDGSTGLLAAAPDVSLWRTQAGYRASRFGMDWLGALLARHGTGHWCLTLDADELLVYPGLGATPLPALTAALDAAGIPLLAALMLDLYPPGRLSAARYAPGDDPTATLTHFDPCGYWWEWQPKYRNISIRGGVRERVFFADRPDLGPHLHKVPLVRWQRGFAYSSSTHLLLPRHLNRGFDARLGWPTGVLLHTKFLPEILAKSAEEKQRRAHFTHAERYEGYYNAILADPCLMGPGSCRYEGPEQLESLGLMQAGRLAATERFTKM